MGTDCLAHNASFGFTPTNARIEPVNFLVFFKVPKLHWEKFISSLR